MKKILALLLVAALAIGMAPMALAADVPNENLGASTVTDPVVIADTTFEGSGAYSFQDLGEGTVELDEKASPSNTKFNYLLGGFDFSTGVRISAKTLTGTGKVGGTVRNITLDYYGDTYGSIKEDKIAAELRVTNGQRVVDKVEIKYLEKVTVKVGAEDVTVTFAKNDRPAYISVVFKDKFVSTSEIEYKFMVYLTKDKKRQADTEVTFEGKYKNQETTVDEGDVYVYLGDDVPVVESLAYLKAIDIELDDGLTVHTKFFNNKKYYANGEAKVRDDDDAILTKYPDIDYVYNIDSVGLSNSYTTVSIDISDKLFVYNSNLEYIGTTAEKLPYSTKYYVSAVELDVDDADISEPSEDGDGYEPDGGMGGDDVPENVNDNPGTGC